MKSGDVEEKRSLGRYQRSPPAQQTPGCLLCLCLHVLSSLACPSLHPLPASQPNPPGTLQAWVLPVHPPPPLHTAPAPFPPLVSWLPCCWLSCRLHVLVTQWSLQRGPLLLTTPLALAPASPRSTLRTCPPCVAHTVPPPPPSHPKTRIFPQHPRVTLSSNPQMSLESLQALAFFASSSQGP